MKGKVGRLIAILLLLVVIVGGSVAAAVLQKNSLAHIYFEKITGKAPAAQTVATPGATDEDAVNAKKLAAQLKKAHFVGNVAVIQDGELVYQRAYGQDPQHTQKNKRSAYQIGTLQNALTAAAVMNLVKDGKVKLSTPVSKYYMLDNATADMTVGSLLDMTSGLTLDAQPDSSLTKNVINWNLTNATTDTPGTYNFQTVNYALLSGIIAQASGVSYQKYLKQHILDPAAVKNTGFVKNARVQKQLMPAFAADGTAVDQATLFQAMNDQLGAKQLYSTAGDMAHILSYISSDRFLDVKYRDQGVIAKNKAAYTGRLTHVKKQLQGRASFAGYHSAVAFNADGETGVVLLSNHQKHDRQLRKAAQTILQQVLAE